MNEIPRPELLRLKAALASEVEALEAQVDALDKQLRNKREQTKAVNTLLGSDGSENEGDAPAPIAPTLNRPSADSRAGFTPTDAYWIPILEALEERGGRDHCEAVLDIVGKKMAAILKPEDHELLPSGISVRWRNRAQWQRQNMVQQGLLRKDSPRGVWEVTPAGRQWLQQQKRKVS